MFRCISLQNQNRKVFKVYIFTLSMENKDLIIKVNGKITKYKCYKKVVISGGSGAVTLPKNIVGKIVCVELKEEKKWKIY